MSISRWFLIVLEIFQVYSLVRCMKESGTRFTPEKWPKTYHEAIVHNTTWWSWLKMLRNFKECTHSFPPLVTWQFYLVKMYQASGDTGRGAEITTLCILKFISWYLMNLSCKINKTFRVLSHMYQVFKSLMELPLTPLTGSQGLNKCHASFADELLEMKLHNWATAGFRKSTFRWWIVQSMDSICTQKVKSIGLASGLDGG